MIYQLHAAYANMMNNFMKFDVTLPITFVSTNCSAYTTSSMDMLSLSMANVRLCQQHVRSFEKRFLCKSNSSYIVEAFKH